MIDAVVTVLKMPFVWVALVGLLLFWGLPKLYIIIERAFKRGG